MNDSERLGRAIAALEMVRGELTAVRPELEPCTRIKLAVRIADKVLAQIREEPK